MLVKLTPFWHFDDYEVDRSQIKNLEAPQEPFRARKGFAVSLLRPNELV